MVNVTFQTGSEQVSVLGSVIYGTDFYTRRLNQFSLELADGEDAVYDAGPNVVMGTLMMKGIDYSEGLDFETWLKEELIFQKNKFSIQGISGVNLGKGLGEGISDARFTGGKSTQSVLQLVAPGKFNLTFPYKFIDS